MYYGMSYALRSKDKIEKIVETSRKQGKSEEQIKQLVSLAIDQMFKKIKEEDMF